MTPAPIKPSTMRDYTVVKLFHYIDTACAALCQAAQDPHEEAVHDMRVAIRRLQQAIRLFKQYLDPKGVKRVKDRLRAVMDIAGELRNRDIAIELVGDEGGDTSELQKQRIECQRMLEQALQGYATPYLAEFWRNELGLQEAAS